MEKGTIMTDKELLFRPWAELKELQNRKLHDFITTKVYPFSPYYREMFDRNGIKPDSIRTTDDLRRIPFTTKADLVKMSAEGKTRDLILQPSEELIKKYLPKGELLKVAATKIFRGADYLKKSLEKEYRPIFLTSTAGTTTGQPMPFLYTHYDLENLKFYGKRIVDIFDMKTDETAVNLFPYAPHLAFWQVFFAGTEAGVLILSTGGGKTMGTEGNLRSIAKLKPRLLAGVPSYVYHLLKEARAQNMDMSFVKKIVLGAARAPVGFKRKLAGLLMEMGASNVSVFGTYGFTEARTAWPECPTDIDVMSGYHTYPDREIFEVINPETGQPVGEGEDGEVVYSTIDSRGSCLLRYRTGDYVKGGITYEPCPHCGRTVPRISSDLVRASNVKDLQISKVKGTLVNFNRLEFLLDGNSHVDEWQIEIAKKDNDPYEVDEISLYVSLLKDADPEEFKRQINKQVLADTELTFNKVEVVTHKEIQKRIEIETSVKARKIVDRRQAA